MRGNAGNYSQVDKTRSIILGVIILKQIHFENTWDEFTRLAWRLFVLYEWNPIEPWYPIDVAAIWFKVKPYSVPWSFLKLEYLKTELTH